MQASQIFWIGLGLEFFEYLDPKVPLKEPLIPQGFGLIKFKYIYNFNPVNHSNI